MNIKEILELLEIPRATQNDWRKLGHKRNNLIKLLDQISSKDAEELINIEVPTKAKYSAQTRQVILDKSKFSIDLLRYNSGDFVQINELIYNYFHKGSLSDRKLLVDWFGEDRVLKHIVKTISYAQATPKNIKSISDYNIVYERFIKKHHDSDMDELASFYLYMSNNFIIISDSFTITTAIQLKLIFDTTQFQEYVKELHSKFLTDEYLINKIDKLLNNA